MSMIWLCITALSSVALVVSDQKFDRSRIRVFPAENQSIAGVFQVTSLNHLKQPQYSFNASEARTLCLSLGVNIASKSQVQEALTRGLETCRFGWIDEHFAVIPRRTAHSKCGQNQMGLVPWRGSVTKKFDVFCFNESDAATQLKDATTDSPNNGRGTQSPSETANSTLSIHSTSTSSHHPASSSTTEAIDSEAEPARFVSTAQSSSGGMAVLITSTCAVLLTAIIIIVYIKMRRSRVLSIDKTQQQNEYIQTEEWTCVKTIKETKISAQDDERIEVDSNSS